MRRCREETVAPNSAITVASAAKQTGTISNTVQDVRQSYPQWHADGDVSVRRQGYDSERGGEDPAAPPGHTTMNAESHKHIKPLNNKNPMSSLRPLLANGSTSTCQASSSFDGISQRLDSIPWSLPSELSRSGTEQLESNIAIIKDSMECMREMFIILHNWSGEDNQNGNFELMEKLQKLFTTVQDLLTKKVDGEHEMLNFTKVIQSCESTKRFLSVNGHEQKKLFGNQNENHHASSRTSFAGISSTYHTVETKQSPHGSPSKRTKQPIVNQSGNVPYRQTENQVSIVENCAQKAALAEKERAKAVDECNSLRRQLQDVQKELHAHTALSSGSYSLQVPTPSLLHTCTNKVKNTVKQCARSIYGEARNSNFDFGFPHFCNLSKELKGSMLRRYKGVAWQAVLCKWMFEDFESSDFNQGNSEPFKTPLDLKKERFTYYSQFKDLQAEDLYQDEAFTKFIESKWKKFMESIKTLAVSDRMKQTHIQDSFLQLGQSVWLLHKVAFACEPANAEIFHVTEASEFDEDYMMEPEDISAPQSSKKTVALMTVPGFILRNSIIKARVCCEEALRA